MKTSFLIVAGGSGKRMNAPVPKQFLLLHGKPLLMHLLSFLHAYEPRSPLVLALPPAYLEFWQQLCFEHHFDIPHQVSNGGDTRFESVKKALSLVVSTPLVAIHDGVRPFITSGLLDRLISVAWDKHCAIPVIPLHDSVRKRCGEHSHGVDRAGLVRVQTPQVFRTEWLVSAYGQATSALYTDDASVWEAAGRKVFLVDGEPGNLKITTEEDWKFAEYLMGTKGRL